MGDAYVNPGNGGQITGTSNSVQDAWDKLRIAGATGAHHADRGGRQALARRSGASAAPRTARVADARARSLTYGELADAAAQTAGSEGRQA